MGYEKKISETEEQLIFPNKNQAKGDIKRISEQELRQIFIDEFKKESLNYLNKSFYSIETPTQKKYKFGKTYEEIKACEGVYEEKGKSALLDMCIFQERKYSQEYKRILNIEFKHKNAGLKNIGKDILKLVHEEQNGVFILLLESFNSETFCNKSETGVIDKLNKSLIRFKDEWRGDNNKEVQIIIIPLCRETIMCYRIGRYENLEDEISSINEIKK